ARREAAGERDGGAHRQARHVGMVAGFLHLAEHVDRTEIDDLDRHVGVLEVAVADELGAHRILELARRRSGCFDWTDQRQHRHAGVAHRNLAGKILRAVDGDAELVALSQLIGSVRDGALNERRQVAAGRAAAGDRQSEDQRGKKDDHRKTWTGKVHFRTPAFTVSSQFAVIACRSGVRLSRGRMTNAQGDTLSPGKHASALPRSVDSAKNSRGPVGLDGAVRSLRQHRSQAAQLNEFNYWRRVASPARFELTTPGLGILCSIQLSYGDSAESRL